MLIVEIDGVELCIALPGTAKKAVMLELRRQHAVIALAFCDASRQIDSTFFACFNRR